jgi:hypothetical protein
MKSPSLIDLEEASLPTESTFQDPPRPLGVRVLRELGDGVREVFGTWVLGFGACLALAWLASLWISALPEKDQEALRRAHERALERWSQGE